ncbi:cupin domain-containing protein [Pseudonocardia acaciae]|uniref:cupin domain-containing protein n=1 Tax=Pseudonocardia acaciae TaxID=551276 RepID=UPI00048E9225|nr:cupin domain-containing protein [Pseudonocardia acaciae]
MISEPVNIDAALATFTEVYSARILSKINDYHVKIARVEGEHVWHAHDTTDEFFLVVSGDFTVSVREASGVVRDVVLGAGDTFVVPKGVEHKPSSTGGVILMFEPIGTSSTGDRHDAVPAHVDSTTGHSL